MCASNTTRALGQNRLLAGAIIADQMRASVRNELGYTISVVNVIWYLRVISDFHDFSFSRLLYAALLVTCMILIDLRWLVEKKCDRFSPHMIFVITLLSWPRNKKQRQLSEWVYE